MNFQSNIQENKDWNCNGNNYPGDSSSLSEQHPREQGLKRFGHFKPLLKVGLSEQHPREQGLKHYTTERMVSKHTIFQSNIQENKDWNLLKEQMEL